MERTRHVATGGGKDKCPLYLVEWRDRERGKRDEDLFVLRAEIFVASQRVAPQTVSPIESILVTRLRLGVVIDVQMQSVREGLRCAANNTLSLAVR